MALLVGCGGNISGGAIGWGQRAIFSGTISSPAATKSVSGRSSSTRSVIFPATLQADLSKDSNGNVTGAIRVNGSNTFDTGTVAGTVVNSQLNIICSGFTNLGNLDGNGLGTPANPASLQCTGTLTPDQSQIVNGQYSILGLATPTGGTFTLITSAAVVRPSQIVLAGTYSGQYNAGNNGAGTLTLTFNSQPAGSTDASGSFSAVPTSGVTLPTGVFSGDLIGSSVTANVTLNSNAAAANGVVGAFQATVTGSTITGTVFDSLGDALATFTLTASANHGG